MWVSLLSLTPQAVGGPSRRHSDPDLTADWLSGDWRTSTGCWLSWRCATRGNYTETTEMVELNREILYYYSHLNLKVKVMVQRSEVSFLPGVVKLLSMLDPSQDSTALSTDGSVLNALWLDRGATMTTVSSSPSWFSWSSPAPGPRPGPITQDFGLDTEGR